jgi:hypothetical protein
MMRMKLRVFRNLSQAPEYLIIIIIIIIIKIIIITVIIYNIIYNYRHHQDFQNERQSLS